MDIEYFKSELHTDLLKYCFWEYKITLKDIEEYINSNDIRLKKFVFEKIFCNSPNVLKDLMIFDKKSLFELIRSYKVPKFNHNFLDLRYRIIRHLLLNENVEIPELKWKL